MVSFFAVTFLVLSLASRCSGLRAAGIGHLLGLSLMLNSEQPVPNTSSACKEDVTPSRTVVVCREFGVVNGGLRSCKANENCVATASRTPTKRSQPWRFGYLSSSDAFKVLRDAVQLEGLTVLQAKEESLYLLAAEKDVPRQPQGSSLFYEFLVKPEDGVVLQRAVVDTTVFIYPVQQPVSDFGALSAKLDGILKRTGFQVDEDLSEKPEEGFNPFFFR